MDKIIDIIYHSMHVTWKNKMIDQGFNYADSTIKEMTDFFQTRVENLEPQGDKKILMTAKKLKEKKSLKKWKQNDLNSSVVESIFQRKIFCVLQHS